MVILYILFLKAFRKLCGASACFFLLLFPEYVVDKRVFPFDFPHFSMELCFLSILVKKVSLGLKVWFWWFHMELFHQWIFIVAEGSKLDTSYVPFLYYCCHCYSMPLVCSAVNNLPMGYPVLQQPSIPAAGQPHLDPMGCGISSCHVVNGVPAPSNFHPIRMNSGNEWDLLDLQVIYHWLLILVTELNVVCYVFQFTCILCLWILLHRFFEIQRIGPMNY